MVFDFEIIMDFALDIDKLNMANLVGKVMDEIMKYQIFFQSVNKNKSQGFAENNKTSFMDIFPLH